MKIYVGTSGYIYNHWQEVFYPKNLPRYKRLEFYSQHFNTVELNVTFYKLPKESAFLGWYKKTPKNFKFVIKGWRFITHLKKLKNCQNDLEIFFKKAKYLKEKLLCVLWQLPPLLKYDKKKLEKFILLLKKYPYYYSFEFRNGSWFNQNTYKILRENNANLCIADSPNFPNVTITTSSFLYLRFHGSTNLYSSMYSEQQLQGWVEKIKIMLKEEKIKFILAFFNNDAFGYAIKNALKFRELLYGNL
ncbi:MAG: DUF72 domain-containing protein [Candidatus Omnitrophica bacterium]|nr:DUF72 domain-containing protein [Candidatus Omnitrophota bacterium]